MYNLHQHHNLCAHRGVHACYVLSDELAVTNNSIMLQADSAGLACVPKAGAAWCETRENACILDAGLFGVVVGCPNFAALYLPARTRRLMPSCCPQQRQMLRSVSDVVGVHDLSHVSQVVGSYTSRRQSAPAAVSCSCCNSVSSVRCRRLHQAVADPRANQPVRAHGHFGDKPSAECSQCDRLKCSLNSGTKKPAARNQLYAAQTRKQGVGGLA